LKEKEIEQLKCVKNQKMHRLKEEMHQQTASRMDELKIQIQKQKMQIIDRYISKCTLIHSLWLISKIVSCVAEYKNNPTLDMKRSNSMLTNIFMIITLLVLDFLILLL
jgi:hypothetical protein